jgi:MraZ protein
VFRGVNPLNLDAKGRMAMPTRYRAQIEEVCAGKLVVTVDRDHCLLMYPLPEWETIERKLVKLPSLNKQARRLQRLLIGHATEVDMDGQGRLLLPPPLRGFAGLDKSVVLIGQGNKFELWNEERWNARRDEWLEGEDDEALDLPAELETLSL